MSFIRIVRLRRCKVVVMGLWMGWIGLDWSGLDWMGV